MGNSEPFQKTVTVLSELLEEGTFRISTEGLLIREFDNARICMIEAKIEPYQFEEINVPETVTKISLSFDNLKKYLGLIDKKEAINLRDQRDTLEISTDKKTVQIPKIMDWSSETAPIPEISYEGSAQVQVGEFVSALKDFLKIGENVRIKTGEGHIELFSGDGLSGTLQEKVESLQTSGFADSIYNVQYLLSALKGIDKNETLYLDWGKDLPIMMGYTIYDNPAVKIRFWLAPRIED